MADAGLPAALAHKRVVLGDAPRGAENEAPGEFGGVFVAAAGTAGAAHGSGKALRLYLNIGGMPNKGFNYGAIYQVPPNSIDIGKGINVMRGHVDANGSIALHEGPENKLTFFTSSAAPAR